MIRFLFLISFLAGFTLLGFASALNTVIKGYAPYYVGQKVELFAIDDYLSMSERLIGEAYVRPDSSFVINFTNDRIRKVFIKSNNNRGFIYVQPGASYSIFFPHRDKYDEYRPLGNQVEIAFYDLPETDINYKILAFDKWYTQFLGLYFNPKSLRSIEFMAQLDTFKMNAYAYYEKDTSFFLKTYVRFSIANLDNMPYLGARNRFEKYDFYLHNYPPAYDNPVYMEYLSDFYTNINDHLPLETNNRIYVGIEKESPTLIINAMRREPTLSNLRIREYAMIRMLNQFYFDPSFPPKAVMAVLDSLKSRSLFPEHQLIAANLILKMNEINVGSKAPDLMFLVPDNVPKSADSLKRHVYIQFIDPSMQESLREVDALLPLTDKYKDYVRFITIYKQNDDPPNKRQKELLQKITWEKHAAKSDDRIFKSYDVRTYPYYILIDHYGYVVSAPALRPTPNGQYETIDKVLFYIRKYHDEERQNQH